MPANQAGISEPSRFNDVQAWTGTIDITITGDTDHGTGSCGRRKIHEKQTFHADVRFQLIDVRQMAAGHGVTADEAGQPLPALPGMQYGHVDAGQGLVPSGGISGSTEESFKGTYDEVCPDHEEHVTESGSGGNSISEGLFDIMPSLVASFFGNWVYRFFIAQKEFQAAGTGYTKDKDSEGKWYTNRVNYTSSHEMLEPISPVIGSANTLDDDTFSQQMVDNLKKTMLAFLLDEKTGLSKEVAEPIANEYRKLEDPVKNGHDDTPTEAWAIVPKTGNVLSDNITVKYEDGEIPRVYNIKWSFTPEKPVDYDLEVEIKDYEQWRPKAKKNQIDPGDTLEITARLIDAKTGEPSSASARKIEFALKDVSSQTGVAMNEPAVGGDTDHDFRFTKEDNPEPYLIIKPEDNEQKITEERSEVLQGQAVHESKVKLSSFDWGGWGTLVVTAFMPNEGGPDLQIKGHLKGGDKNKKEIPLPKGTDKNTHIAESWKKEMGVEGKADSWDEETEPKGQAGCKGDGLTLYEEYRGFYTDDKSWEETDDEGHFFGDPKRKEVFVIDKTGSAQTLAGIKMYRDATHLHVHLLDQKHMAGDRIINPNGGTKGHIKQHGISLEFDKKLNGALGEAGATKVGTPKISGRVKLLPLGDSAWRDVVKANGNGNVAKEFTSVVAHEMGHGSHIEHHGDTDEQTVKWEAWMIDDALPTYQVYEYPMEEGAVSGPGIPVWVTREGGADVDPKEFYLAKYMYVANPHGQHSGDAACFMRYDMMDAFVPEGQSNVRVWLTKPTGESMGTNLCDTKNAAGPHKRCGTAGKGQCRSQLCVSDR